jgi:hypothetical protein
MWGIAQLKKKIHLPPLRSVHLFVRSLYKIFLHMYTSYINSCSDFLTCLFRYAICRTTKSQSNSNIWKLNCSFSIKTWDHKFSKNLGATSKLLPPKWWHEASSTLRAHRYGIRRHRRKKKFAKATWRPRFMHPSLKKNTDNHPMNVVQRKVVVRNWCDVETSRHSYLQTPPTNCHWLATNYGIRPRCGYIRSRSWVQSYISCLAPKLGAFRIPWLRCSVIFLSCKVNARV